MVHDTSLLGRVLTLIDDLPLPSPAPQGRGRRVVYGERLYLKALALMVVRRLPTVHDLLAVLAAPEMAPAWARLTLADRWALPVAPDVGATPARHNGA